MIYGAGMLELGVTFDFAQLVMDNEMFKMIKRAIMGIPVTDENIALEIIHEVGPGGHFVGHQHTFDHFRKVQSQSKLIDRRNRASWLEEGGTSMTERAYEEANSIINSHKPEALPEGAVKKIREIVEESEEEYGLK